MLSLLMKAYTSQRKRKTLIFNNGVYTSKKVCAMFEDAGYPVRHLDNRTSPAVREEILKWFRTTPSAILTSVSILTTGFDEPSVKTIILNRATTSLTLYHQMIGRGSRPMANKKTFTIIDLGNNVERFGPWEQAVDWRYIFDKPQEYCNNLNYGSGSESAQAHQLPMGIRAAFPNTAELSFDIETEFLNASQEGKKHKTVIQRSIRQHALMCIENSTSISEALQLAELLSPEIDWRVRQYSKCIDKATKNYRDWLMSDYKSRLKQMITKVMHLQESVAVAS
jgi:superfamily II DNA or RNA helicase